jgi:hypothetical protein
MTQRVSLGIIFSGFAILVANIAVKFAEKPV